MICSGCFIGLIQGIYVYISVTWTCTLYAVHNMSYRTHNKHGKSNWESVLLYSEGLWSSLLLCWDFPRQADLIRNIHHAVQNSVCYFLPSKLKHVPVEGMGWKTRRPIKSHGFQSIAQVHNIHFIYRVHQEHCACDACDHCTYRVREGIHVISCLLLSTTQQDLWLMLRRGAARSITDSWLQGPGFNSEFRLQSVTRLYGSCQNTITTVQIVEEFKDINTYARHFR